MDLNIQELIILQQVDSAIKTERDTIAAVPAAIAAIEARSQELEANLERSREGLQEAQKERRHLEGEVDLAKEKLSKYQSQLMEVKTNETYRVMLREIETAKAEVAAREERILENMLLSDELEGQLAGSEKEIETARGGMEREKVELERKRREAEERLHDLEGERRGVAARIGGEMLSAYENIAKTRGGVAVTGTRDELCLACRVKVRPQVFQEVLQGAIHQCDSCNRFLFISEEPEDASGPGATEAERPDGSPPGAAPRDEPPS